MEAAAAVDAPSPSSSSCCCRICGRTVADCVDVFGEEGRRRQILNKIAFCFSKQVLHIHPRDRLPKGVCQGCQDALANSFNNAKKIHYLQLILREKYSKDVTPITVRAVPPGGDAPTPVPGSASFRIGHDVPPVPTTPSSAATPEGGRTDPPEPPPRPAAATALERPRTLDLSLPEIFVTASPSDKASGLTPTASSRLRDQLLSTPDAADLPPLPSFENVFASPPPPPPPATTTSAGEASALEAAKRALRTPSCDFPSDILSPVAPAASAAVHQPSSATPVPQQLLMPPTIHLPEIPDRKDSNGLQTGSFNLEKIVSDTVLANNADVADQGDQELQQQQRSDTLPQPAAGPRDLAETTGAGAAAATARPPTDRSTAALPTQPALSVSPQQLSLRVVANPTGSSSQQQQLHAHGSVSPLQGRMTANVTLPDGSVIQVPIVNGNKLPSIHIVQPQQATATADERTTTGSEGAMPTMETTTATSAAAVLSRPAAIAEVPSSTVLPPPLPAVAPPPPPPRPPASVTPSAPGALPVPSSTHLPPRPQSLPAPLAPSPAAGPTQQDLNQPGASSSQQHHLPVIYRCAVCPGKIFPNAEMVGDHIRIVHGTIVQQHHLTTQQPVLSQRPPLQQQQQLQQQPQQQQPQQQYVCPVCGDSFADQPSLRQHFQSSHISAAPASVATATPAPPTPPAPIRPTATHQSATAATSSSPHVCDTCHKTFSSRTTLRRHQQMHLLGPAYYKRHKCTLCGGAFSQRSNLLSHMRTHEKRKKQQQQEQESTKVSSRSDETSQSGRSSPTGKESDLVLPDPPPPPPPAVPSEPSEPMDEAAGASTSSSGPVASSSYLCATCGKSFGVRNTFAVHSIVCGKKKSAAPSVKSASDDEAEEGRRDADGVEEDRDH